MLDDVAGADDLDSFAAVETVGPEMALDPLALAGQPIVGDVQILGEGQGDDAVGRGVE